MSIRENVKRLLAIDQKETVLWSEIAAMVPTAALRDVITRMIQMETRGPEFWKKVFPGGIPEDGATPYQIDFNPDAFPDTWDSPGRTLAEKLKHAVKLDTEQLKILADIIAEVKSSVARWEIVRKVNEEYRELFFWSTLLLVFDTGATLYETKA